jgi:hypothetical protein
VKTPNLLQKYTYKGKTTDGLKTPGMIFNMGDGRYIGNPVDNTLEHFYLEPGKYILMWETSPQPIAR